MKIFISSDMDHYSAHRDTKIAKFDQISHNQSTTGVLYFAKSNQSIFVALR